MACWLLIATENGSFGGISCCGNDKGAGGGSKEGEREQEVCKFASLLLTLRTYAFLSPLYIFVCVCVSIVQGCANCQTIAGADTAEIPLIRH